MNSIDRPSFEAATKRQHMKSLTFCVFPCDPQASGARIHEREVPGIYRVCIPSFVPLAMAVFGAMAAFYLDVPLEDADQYDFLFEDDATGDMFIVDDNSPTPDDDMLTLLVMATSQVRKVAQLPA